MPKSLTISWVPEEARRLRSLGATRGKLWSLAQVCEHLALAMEATANMPRAGEPLSPPPPWDRAGPFRLAKGWFMKRGLFLTQKLPEGVPSPEFVRPTDGPSEDAALQQLADAVRAFESKLARERTGAPMRWPVHPVLGPMRGRDWLAFHDLHARHHFKFMKANQQSAC